MATPGKWRTGDNHTPPYLTRQPSRWQRNLVLLALLLIVVTLILVWKNMREQALVGAAYGARVGCVCRFVSQRSLKSCEGDIKVAGLGRAAGFVSLSEDAASRTIKASVPFLATQSATFDQNAGCLLEPWQE